MHVSHKVQSEHFLLAVACLEVTPAFQTTSTDMKENLMPLRPAQMPEDCQSSMLLQALGCEHMLDVHPCC